MLYILLSIIAGFIGMNVGGLTQINEYMLLGGMVGVSIPQVLILLKIYNEIKKEKNTEDLNK